jgi:hypothetical protein
MQWILLFMTPFAKVLVVNMMALVTLPPNVREVKQALWASKAWLRFCSTL